jgi:hypothetical protein
MRIDRFYIGLRIGAAGTLFVRSVAPSGGAIVRRVAGPGSLDCSQQRIWCHPGLLALANQDFGAGGTNRGFRFSSTATNVNVASVTLCWTSSVRLRRHGSIRIVIDVLPIRKMLA